MWIIFLDIAGIAFYVFLFRRLFSLSNTKITTLSKQYTSLIVVISLFSFLGFMFLVGMTVRIFWPTKINTFPFYYGLVGAIGGIAILIDAYKREKATLKNERTLTEFKSKLIEFRYPTYTSRYQITRYEDFGYELVGYNFFWMVLGSFGGFDYPFYLFLIVEIISFYLLSRWYFTLIWHWAIDQRIISRKEVSKKDYYILYFLH